MIITREEEIRAQRNKTPEEILLELFDFHRWTNIEGRAFVFVAYQGTDGRVYGRYRNMTEGEYQEHETRVSQGLSGTLEVYVLDMLYDPETKTHIQAEG